MKELDNHPELKFHHANWIGNLSMQIDFTMNNDELSGKNGISIGDTKL